MNYHKKQANLVNSQLLALPGYLHGIYLWVPWTKMRQENPGIWVPWVPGIHHYFQGLP